MRQPHIEFQKEHGGHEQVPVGPKLDVVHKSNAARIVTDIDSEPNFLDDESRALRKPVSFSQHGTHDVVHDSFAEEDHTQPTKARNEAQFLGSRLVDSAGRITHTEILVAAVNEGSTGL